MQTEEKSRDRDIEGVREASCGAWQAGGICEKGERVCLDTVWLMGSRVNIEALAQSCLKKVPIWNIGRARYTEPLSCRKPDFPLLLCTTPCTTSIHRPRPSPPKSSPHTGYPPHRPPTPYTTATTTGPLSTKSRYQGDSTTLTVQTSLPPRSLVTATVRYSWQPSMSSSRGTSTPL